MKFCTVINCIDGRIQIPVIEYLKKRFKIEFVDSITEAGPNRILAENKNDKIIDEILNKVNISVEKHNSRGIAIVGHYDCAGNPYSKEEQIMQINKTIKLLQQRFYECEIIGLWVNENWIVEEVI